MELPIEPLTTPLQDWQPPPFAVLVARGHTSSVPVLDLLALGKETITVGRAPDTDLVIAEPTVSRHHARIYRRQGRWVVRDLNSTSGKFVS
ncbi:MAG: FHA domain-containing protein [Anaerolineae bacterium]|nr:FHA domain-containing protein [Anaerolineae bacterium]